jgi:hypothetical protein
MKVEGKPSIEPGQEHPVQMRKPLNPQGDFSSSHEKHLLLEQAAADERLKPVEKESGAQAARLEETVELARHVSLPYKTASARGYGDC